MSNDYYVYEHIRLDNNTCFYVGKGHGKRAYTKKRNPHHDRIVEKHGMRVEIIANNLTEDEAYKLERETIKRYVFEDGYGIDIEGYRKDDGSPCLTNSTFGGDGSYGMVHSREWCEQHSNDMKGDKNPMYGINNYERYSIEEAKAIKDKLSKAFSGSKNPMYGVSPRERMSEDKFNEWHDKIVSRGKSLTGANNPNYGNDTLHNKVKDNPELRIQYYSRKGSQNGRSRKVELYDDNNCFLGYFEYLGKCAEYIIDKLNLRSNVNTVRSQIIKCLKTGKTYRGFSFKEVK